MSRSKTWTALIVLTVVTLLTFANAAHDALVFDDKFFVGPNKNAQLDNLGDAFKQDLWGKNRRGKGLYRPLLLIKFELETRLFGAWLPGYHLVNIFMHLAATLALFGFLACLRVAQKNVQLRLQGLHAVDPVAQGAKGRHLRPGTVREGLAGT